MLKNMNSVLKDMLLEIVIFGVVFQILGFILAGDQLAYALGLWAGIICSMGMAIHMEWSISTGMEMGDHARGHILKHTIIRYAFVAIVFVLLSIYSKTSIIPCFLGAMTLKVAAYLQPFTHKFILKVQGNQDSH